MRLDDALETRIKRHLFGRSIFGQLHSESAANGCEIGGKSDARFTCEKHANVIAKEQGITIQETYAKA